MEKKISVVVPIFNKEKYLKKCINSIINQTYANLEILLINDGSQDNSEQICNEFASKDKRIKVISTENRGAALARNSGIELATGDYFSFIDADDFIHNTYYEIMLKMIEDNNAEIVECGFETVDENSNYVFPVKNNITRKLNREEALVELYGKGDEEHVKTVIMCNKLFKRDLFNDISYIPGRVIDDETIIYKLISKSNGIVELYDTLYAYVQSSNSVMRKDFAMKRLDDSIDVYNECIEFFENEPYIKACCIKRAIYFYGEFIKKIARLEQYRQSRSIPKGRGKL